MTCWFVSFPARLSKIDRGCLDGIVFVAVFELRIMFHPSWIMAQTDTKYSVSSTRSSTFCMRIRSSLCSCSCVGLPIPSQYFPSPPTISSKECHRRSCVSLLSLFNAAADVEQNCASNGRSRSRSLGRKQAAWGQVGNRWFKTMFNCPAGVYLDNKSLHTP